MHKQLIYNLFPKLKRITNSLFDMIVLKSIKIWKILKHFLSNCLRSYFQIYSGCMYCRTHHQKREEVTQPRWVEQIFMNISSKIYNFPYTSLEIFKFHFYNFFYHPSAIRMPTMKARIHLGPLFFCSAAPPVNNLT